MVPKPISSLIATPLGIKLYPHNLPRIIYTHELGSYDYLPELNVMNDIIAKNAITRLVTYKHYIIAGDLSGRISVIDTVSKITVKVLKVNGAICSMVLDGGRLSAEI